MRRCVRMMAGALCLLVGLTLARAADVKKPGAGEIDRARTTVRMLDDLYKAAAVSITEAYTVEQSTTPTAAVAKEIFDAMHKKGWHRARLIDATGKPKKKENVASTDFEKRAVAALRSGQDYLEEVAEADGKPVLRAATRVPALMQQCVVCHGVKPGALLGVIVYEVPIK
jgi:hypothetical protein